MNYDIKIEHLDLIYKDVHALNDITTTLPFGKIYGLIGRNGAGKTSLLSILGNYKKQTNGTIRINDEPLFDNAQLMQHIGFFYEVDFSEDDYTVDHYIKLASRYRPQFDDDYAHELIKTFQLPLKRKVQKLSKGQQATLEVILGLASRLPITIFDEITFSMDAPTRVKFYQLLLEEQQRYPRTFILSTHLVSEMDHLFDEVLIIHQGELLIHESYEDFVSRGLTITGDVIKIDQLAQNLNVIKTQQLGRTKQIMVYDHHPEALYSKAQQEGFEVGPIPLQDLFIHLTEEKGG